MMFPMPHHTIVLGGYDGTSELDTTKVLDLATMRFRPGPCMETKRSICAASMLDKRRLLVLGGYDGSSSLDTTQILDVVTMGFSPGPRMGRRRSGCVAAMID